MNQATQTITFGAIASQTAGVSIPLTATASSGLAVSFTSTTPTVCSVSGSSASLLTGGTCSIVASQAGNSNYGPAPSVAQSFAVANNVKSQTITFAPASPLTYGVAPVLLNGTATSGLAVSYSVVSGPGTLSGNTLTVTGAGTIVIAANQAGNSSYSAAMQVSATIVVNKATPTITWATPSAITYGTALSSTQLNAVAAGVGGTTLAGTFTYSPVSGTTPAAGSDKLSVSFVPTDTADYTSPVTATTTLTVNQASQTITFTPISPVTYGVSPIALTATGGASGSPVTFTLVSGPGSLSGNTLTVSGAGTIVIAANQAGNSSYTAATQVTASIVVSKATPVITWTTPSAITYGTTISSTQLNAAATGVGGTTLAGSFTYSPLAGTTPTVGSDMLSVSFVPTDSADYTSPISATTMLTVNQASQTITFAPVSPVTYGVSPIVLTATGGASGSPVTFTLLSGPGSLSGSTLTVTGAGTIVVAANQAGNASYTAATQVTASIVVNPASQTITFNTIPAQTVNTTLNLSGYATASSGLPVTWNYVNNGNCTISGNIVSFLNTGACGIIANQAGNSNYSAASSVGQVVLVNNPLPQTITFAPASPVTYGVSPITLTASGGGSGNPVTFTLVSGPGSLNGSTLTVNGAGTIVISANQAASSNGKYSAAAQVTASIVVNPASQTINFAPPSAVTFGVAPITLTASGGSSGNPVTFTVVSGPGTLSGSTLTVTGAGTIVVAANEAGNSSYSAATQVSTSIVVNKATPSITWATPSAITYGTSLSSTQLNAVAAGVGGTTLAGTFTYAPLAGTIPAVGSDTLSVSFVPTDTADYSSPVTATTNLTVDTAGQTITFAPATPVTYGVSPITLTATGGASGNPVTFTLLSGPGTLSGSSLTITGAGTIVVAANQAGNSSYSAATQVTASIVVNPASQTITFNTIPAQTAGGTVTLTATASSGLAVSFASSTPSVCTVSGSSAALLTGGTCSIVASQAGNGNYSPAPNITQSFTVAPAGTFTISLGSTTITLMPNNGVADALTVNSLNGFTGSVTLSLTGLPAGVSSTFYPSNPTTSSTNLIVFVPTGTAPGSYPLTITGVSGSLTFSTPATLVVQGTQTISFAAIAAQTAGGSLALNATASSGLAVSYSSSTPSVCTVSGNTVTLVAAGTCTVTAAQTGNTVYTAATPVTQSFTVASKQQSQTINFNTNATQTSGTSLALTATASSGLTVTFTSSTTSVCTVSGSTASLLAGGTCTLTASQAGNSSYSAATPVSQSFTVLQSQTITFNTIATQHVGTPLNLAGYATASSGLPITWTLVNNGNCSISGTTVTFINSGACGIIANQAGNSTYAAAAAVGQVVQVAAALQSQTITFKTIATQKVGTTLNVSSYATASSGLTVTFTVVNNGNCSISGTNVTFLNTGACGVIANQAGNSTYSAAAAVGQVVQVSN